VAACLADPRVGGEGFEPGGVAQVAPGQLGGRQELREGLVRTAARHARRPHSVGETCVELLLRVRAWQGVERGDAFDEEDLNVA